MNELILSEQFIATQELDDVILPIFDWVIVDNIFG